MNKLDELRKQHAHIVAEGKFLREQLFQVGKTECDLRRKIRNLEQRERLSKLIGQRGAVVVSSECRDAIAGKPAELLKVNRTRAVVNVDGVEWSVPLDLLAPSGSEVDEMLREGR